MRQRRIVSTELGPGGFGPGRSKSWKRIERILPRAGGRRDLATPIMDRHGQSRTFASPGVFLEAISLRLPHPSAPGRKTGAAVIQVRQYPSVQVEKSGRGRHHNMTTWDRTTLLHHDPKTGFKQIRMEYAWRFADRATRPGLGQFFR